MRFPKNETLSPEAEATATTAAAEDDPSQQQQRQPQAKSHPTLKSALYDGWFKKLIDVSALRDWPFVLMIGGLLTTFMGIYTILYYINLFTAQRTSAPSNVTRQTLTMVNAASTVGRILPSALADRVGPTHVLAATALLSGMLNFALLAVSSTAGLIPWTIAFGSISGAFQGLPAAGVVSISNSRDNIGVRLGVVLGVVGCGVLIAEPIAGAILAGRGGWPGLTAWSGSLMFVGSVFMVAARVTNAGVAVKVKL
jgi:predicted MFS family arabinose efflux permease